jgi:mono/diheme cytochrome c family protein
MKHIITSASLILGLLLMGIGIRAALAQETPTTMKKVPVHSTQSITGKDLFHEYCAVCHGPAGKGDGPAAAALKAPLPDLTQISAKNGGKFPELQIQHIINGEAGVPAAHGSKDMPVWGYIFRHMGANPDIGTVRVHNLMKYIEEIQAK